MANTPHGIASGALTFDDEFATFNASPDGSTGWATSFPYGGEAARTLSGNNEAEYYSDSSVGKNPFSDTNGVLSITASPAAPGSNPYNLPYDSGLITSYKSFSQLYGYFEIRAQLPAGQGLWPAFWMLPASGNYTSELDVFEVLGSNPSQLFSTTHGSTGGVWSSDFQALNVANTSTGYHTYGVDWEPTTITFYMDGQNIASAPTPSSMNTPMFLLLNLAVGGQGSWPGAPNSSTILPASMNIDYVRAYATANTQLVSGTAAIHNLPSSSPPPRPIIGGLTVGTDTGASSTDGITSDTTPTLTGTAAPGTTITLHDSKGGQFGTTIADPTSGAWSIAASAPLAQGLHIITATATNSAGAAVSTAYKVTIDSVAPLVFGIYSNVAPGHTLTTGQTLTLTLRTAEPVLADFSGGSPTLTFSDGATATYDAAHSTATAMVFTSTVLPGQQSSDLRVTGLALNGATMSDSAGNALSTANIRIVMGNDTHLKIVPSALNHPLISNERTMR